MKTPNDYPLVSFRPGKELAPEIESRASGTYAEYVKDTLTAYYTLLRLSLPSFSTEEKLILNEALSDWLATPETVHLLWAEVQGYTDNHAFIERLRGLSRFSCWAIVDAVQQWNADE